MRLSEAASTPMVATIPYCGGTCDVWPAGGVWAGWERTGLAGGVGPECEQVSALRPIRECLYLCACFVVSRGTGEQREGGPTRSVPEIACRGSPNARTLLDITFNFSLKSLFCFVTLCNKDAPSAGRRTLASVHSLNLLQ